MKIEFTKKKNERDAGVVLTSGMKQKQRKKIALEDDTHNRKIVLLHLILHLIPYFRTQNC